MHRSIARVALVVRDYDEAIDYYTRCLGFELLEDTPLGAGKRRDPVQPAWRAGGALGEGPPGRQVMRPLLIWTACVLALLASACERPSSSYATHADAVAAGALAAGWIPELVPATATQIQEIHDLDTEEVCLRFELPVEERRRLVAPMRRLSTEEVAALPSSCRLRPGWWFEGLIEQQPSNDAALHAEVYETSVAAWGGPVYVAIDRVGPAVYLWSR